MARAHRFPLVVLAICAVSAASTGCFNGGVIVPPDGNSNGNDNGGNDNGGHLVPEVRLTVSNPTPAPNEQLELRCAVTNDADGPVTFEFQPRLGRLVVDEAAGRATFIVDAADVNVAISFTCRGENPAGPGPFSDPVIVTATGP